MTPIIRTAAALEARCDDAVAAFREFIRVKPSYELEVQGIYPCPTGRYFTRDNTTGETVKVEFYRFYLSDPLGPTWKPTVPEEEMRRLLLDRLDSPEQLIRGAAVDVAKRLYPDMDTRPPFERFLSREAARTGRSIDDLRAEVEAA